jgi:DNA-binding transcriptional ArsR family regulator
MSGTDSNGRRSAARGRSVGRSRPSAHTRANSPTMVASRSAKCRTRGLRLSKTGGWTPPSRSAMSPSRRWYYIWLHIYMCCRMLIAMPAEIAVLEAIAEPTRRRILDAVRGCERSVGELVEQVGMHQPGVSRHLKVLRDAGLVEVRRDAQRRLYRLRPEPLMELDAWLEPYRAEWTARLDSLERHLRRTATPIPPSTKEH